MKRARGDLPRLSRAELALLVTDAEADRAAQDDPELLVLVAVLLGDRARLELDDRERQPLAVDGARRDPSPDLARDKPPHIVEGAHPIGGRKVVSPRSGGAP